MPGKCQHACHVTLQQCLICEKEACKVYWFVHEQADDEADEVLLIRYTYFSIDQSKSAPDLSAPTSVSTENPFHKSYLALNILAALNGS